MDVDQENNSSKKSESIKRKQCYRNLLNRIEDLQEANDHGINTVKVLGDIFKEVNQIDNQCAFSERVEYADETLLESVVLSSASGALVRCLENLDIFTSTYDPQEFSQTFLTHVNNETDEEDVDTPNWLNLIKDAREIVPVLPNYWFLYGAFDPTKVPEPKIRKKPAREAQEHVDKKRLQKVHTIEKEEEGIETTINFLMQVLIDEYKKNNSEPILYFDFVIDSNNFSSTVENMFYTSFLVRDGKVKLSIVNDNVPVLEPMRKRYLKEFRQNDGVNTQMIASLTLDSWKGLKREGFIQKHRELMNLNS